MRGPKGTTPGGEWLKKLNTAVERDCCTGLLCCLIGDCSIIVIMCCPLSTDFVYRDPVKATLHNEEGHILPGTTKLTKLSKKEFDELNSKYAVAATTEMVRK